MQLKKVLIIGAGTMGSGIAQWFLQTGLKVCLSDNNLKQCELAFENMLKSWSSLIQKNKYQKSDIEKFKKNFSIQNLDSLESDFDLVIEAIIEDMNIKNQLFTKLDSILNEDCCFASNTSSFSIEKMSAAVSKCRQERFIGLHFFNPATIMKLVEIVNTPKTQKKISEDLYHWFEEHDKKPARCIDSPAFIVNRVARNFYGEALRIVETYDPEKIKEVDLVMKDVAGFKMGPFELMDLIGIDINYSVTNSVWEAFQKIERFAPHPLQKQMVELNKLGKKTKEGFYKYE